MYVRELVVSYRCRETPAVDVDRYVHTARDAAALLGPLIEAEPVEVVGILCLDTRRRVLAYREVSRGGLDRTLTSPREMFQAALLVNAGAIVVGHNHPSGDPRPSPDDRALTVRVVQAGEIIGIRVVDHIIVGQEGRYFSFHEKGELPCA